MALEKINISSIDIIEEHIFSKPRYKAILSLIAYFQHNKKNIQRAHLIRALVKNAKPSPLQKDSIKSVDDKNALEKSVINQFHKLNKIAPKIMFNSIANLDKTVQYLRKLGLITNQYIRGYPRIILTDKGLTLFYRHIIKRMVDELVQEGKALKSISDHILTSVIPIEKKKTMVFSLPEFFSSD